MEGSVLFETAITRFLGEKKFLITNAKIPLAPFYFQKINKGTVDV